MSDLAARENLPADQPLADLVQGGRWSDPPDFVPGPDNSFLGGFGPLVLGAGVLNFLTLPLMRASAGDAVGAMLGAVTSGVIFSEGGILTLWLVWGPGDLIRRLVMHWFVACGLFLAWGTGFLVAVADGPGGGFVAEVLGTAVCSLPLISLAAQLPLWPLRTHFGWRVERPAHAGDDHRSQALSIRDLLLGTVVTAVTLGCARLTPLRLEAATVFWLRWSIIALAITVISAVSLIPALLFLLRSKERTTAVGSLCVYAGLAALVVFAFVAASTGGRSIPVEAFLVMGLAICSYIGGLAIPLLMVRGRGYRLTFPRDRRKAVATLAAEAATAIPPAGGGHREA